MNRKARQIFIVGIAFAAIGVVLGAYSAVRTLQGDPATIAQELSVPAVVLSLSMLPSLRRANKSDDSDSGNGA